jgi:hypothetical protein
MDIHTAAKYMDLGYRARRRSWKPDVYICFWGASIIRGPEGSSACLSIKNLLSDDWEIITTNIVGHFPIEYGD